MKIVLVINSIISHKEKISSIIVEGNEFYFLYDGKHKWSIEKTTDDYKEHYIVNFFPNKPDDIIGETLDEIRNNRLWGATIPNISSYSTRQLNTVEAYETFKDLYQILFDKVYGIDDVFNDILSEF